jgi:Spy/CpxP family protein refolding chaperone
MRRLCLAAGSCVLALALVASVGTSGEKKAGKKGVQLPPGFKALKLTPEQDKKARTILVDYRAKIDELKKQIDDLEAQRKVELMRVLTAEQKAKYIGESPKVGTTDTKKAKKAPPEK